MKRVSRLLAFASLGLLVAAPAVHAASQASAFAGSWEATDPADGSNLSVSILAINTAQIWYTDDEANTACSGQASLVFTSFLLGTIEGDEMGSTMLHAKCGSRPVPFRGLTIGWELLDQGDADPSNDLLINEFGETYTRTN
jgi:hypothetical protein